MLAFELLNEPFAGNFYKDPTLMYPGRADRVRLQPFYDRVAPLLRAGDPDRLVMFESCTWSDEFGCVRVCFMRGSGDQALTTRCEAIASLTASLSTRPGALRWATAASTATTTTPT
jgi:hypothetical protein